MKIGIPIIIIALIIASTGRLMAQDAKTEKPKPAPPFYPAAPPFKFEKLNTEPYPGKQDDIFPVNENLIWYGNGQGKLYRSTNGGKSFELILNKPGTFWRCLAFTDSLHGYAGNVGTDYFPNVTDTIPLYQTEDGGKTWIPAVIKGGIPKGLCAFAISRQPYINHGVLAYKNTIWGAGRVGSPAWLLKSTNDGKTFQSEKMDHLTSMIFDIYFTTPDTGFICGASNADVDKSKPVVLRTTNAGKSWQKVYEGMHLYELTWKCSFPDKKTGFVSIQNYNPDTTQKYRYIIKTTNAGQTWHEMPLDTNHALRQFGIGFVDPLRGWVGTTIGGRETTDGGKTWHKVTLGRAVNKFRFLKKQNGKQTGFAIGMDVYKLD